MAPRRSPRLPPQIHASEEASGMARRRSQRLNPQIQPSEQGAGVGCRRSPRLRPQIPTSEEGARMAHHIRRRRSRGSSPEAAAAASSLPDDDDMLREILLRLPPHPSSLPHASAVCKRWLGLVTDPKFHREFYTRHRKPPLLGFFQRSDQGLVVTSVLDPPDRIPPQRFDLGRCNSFNLLDCRHNLVLVQDTNQKEVVVCNLITCGQHRVAIPLELRNSSLRGAVLRAAAGHVPGSCHSGPFKMVLVSAQLDSRPLTCVYSSETGLWGNFISLEAPCRVCFKPVVLVGNCLYWFSLIDGILEFDLDENSLNVISVPPVTNNIHYMHFANCQIIEAGDGVIGFAILLYPHFQLWQRNVNAHGVDTWVLWKTIEMHSIIGLPPRIAWLLGYDEDTDALFLLAGGSVYKVQLKLLQSKKLYETHNVSYYQPFKSFSAAGTTIAGEVNGAEMLHNA